MIALIDCNNFYASCERVFAPDLRRRPVCVLSNNDGCIVARSQEVKDLGVPMGAPYFKWRKILTENNAAVLSSNYALYADMSRRVMEILSASAPEVEIYSIDEAFLRFGEMHDLTPHLHAVRAKVKKWVGLPVSVGVGKTKVLAKLASRMAKQMPSGVCNLADYAPARIEQLLQRTPVGDLWGIGRKSTEKLQAMGINNARQLRDTPDSVVRKHLTVVGLRIVHELRGTPCITFDEAPQPKKQIQCTRSFGRVTSDRQQIAESVAWHASRAGEKLRAQGSVAAGIAVVLRTNPHRKQDPQHGGSVLVNFHESTSDTSELIKAAQSAFVQLWRQGYKYQKSGVLLVGLSDESKTQFNLFTAERSVKSWDLMKSVDKLNKSFGRDAVRYGATGMKRKWRMKCDGLTAAYTTSWSELLLV